MPQYPPPRKLRTDNIKRVLGRATTEGLLRALGTLRGTNGLWPENDPDSYRAYLDALMRDPRLRRTRMESIPERHPDACLRLDRCPTERLTVSCKSCGVAAVYAVADLRGTFRVDQNIMALPTYLLPCKSKRDRREGACRLRAEPGGYEDAITTVKYALGAVR